MLVDHAPFRLRARGSWTSYKIRSNIFPVGIQKTAVRVQINHIHPRSHGTADLYHRALLIVNYVFTVLKKTHIPWLQRHCLVYMWFVHCGGTFKRPRTMVQSFCKLHPSRRRVNKLVHSQKLYMNICNCTGTLHIYRASCATDLNTVYMYIHKQ